MSPPAVPGLPHCPTAVHVRRSIVVAPSHGPQAHTTVFVVRTQTSTSMCAQGKNTLYSHGDTLVGSIAAILRLGMTSWEARWL